MRRRALLIGGKEQKPLYIRVATTLSSGASPNDTFIIPANAPGETYNYSVDWGDGVVTRNHTGNAEHTYATRGIKHIKIYGKFPRFYFNNGGDRRKLIAVLDWGDIKYSTNQARAFYGCESLSFIAEDVNGWYNGITNGSDMFRDALLPSLPDNMSLINLMNGYRMFYNNPITSAIGLKLHKINYGTGFMNSANLPVSQYSDILIDIEANNTNNNVTIDFGSSKYNMTAKPSREMLEKRGWVITDGGLE